MFICLTGTRSSIILKTGAGAPIWRHWGAAVQPASLEPAAKARRRPTFSTNVDVPLTVFPTFGYGWFGESALLAHRQGGHACQQFDDCATEWLEAGRAVRIRLSDRVAQLSVIVTLAIDANDVLTLSSEIENEGEDQLELNWLAAGVLPLPARAALVRSYGGRHGDEFREQIDTLGRAGWRRQNRRGLTSHADFPGAIAVTAQTGDHEGEAWAAHLAWSGNHQQVIERADDGGCQWQLGEWLAPGEIRLEPGETYRSPDLIAVWSDQGLNGVAQGFHAALRARIDWPGGAMRPRPVTLNSWEACYFDVDTGRVKSLADAAAALGVERFVLDDGWFKGRTSDRSGLGDWTPDPRRFLDGLGPIAAHVCGLGMEFGLWIEPEMANPDSDLLRAHPDWALGGGGRPPLTARSQLVLDLSRPEVADHLFARIDALLVDLPISYLKWDHNRDLAPATDADGRTRYHDQVEAAYALMARIRKAHPHIEIEACAGGGGRADFGVMRFAHRIWTSDNLDARVRHDIQRGFLRFFPPEVMGSHIGAAPAHMTGRTQPLDFRAAIALGGHFGVELDPTRLGDPERDRVRWWIERHKMLRSLIHGAPTWLGEGHDRLTWHAHGQAEDFVLLVHRLDPATSAHAAPLILPFVDQARDYAVTPLHGEPAAARVPGAVLARIGLNFPQIAPETSVILRFSCH